MTADTSTRRNRDQLAEVWGDVVSRRQLALAILIGAACSVSVYLFVLEVFAPLASTPSIGKAIAMLAGIGGAVSGGTLCSFAFPPKRMFVDRALSATAWQVKVLEQLEQDEGSLGSISDLSHETAQEMRAVGLYPAFEELERNRSAALEKGVK